MVDVDLLRRHPDLFRDALKKRGTDLSVLDRALKLDQEWRKKLSEIEKLRSEQRYISKKETGSSDKAKSLKEKINQGDKDLRRLEDERSKILSQIPNLVSSESPSGLSEESNKVIRKVGKPRTEFKSPHDQLMINLGWLNTDKASRVSGSRWRYLLSDAAKAHFNLFHRAFQFACSKGFQPVIPPSLVRDETMTKAAFFPFGREDTYFIEKDNLYLTGTSEMTLLSLFLDEILEEKSLPIRKVGFSTCFRREAGSYGKDVKGIFRTHQFDKVELISICGIEQSEEELSNLVKIQEEFVNQFSLPYRVVEVATGDLAAKEYRKNDLECWFPSQERYRETHSASNCTDFQSRGLAIKYQPKKDNKKIIYPHCLNATLATERLLIAIIENNQDKDGRVNLPQILT